MSLFHTLIAFFNLTVGSTLQPLILLDVNTYNVNPKLIGRILAELILFQTVSKILLTPIYGYLMDNAGRKPMVLIGAGISALGYIMTPLQKSVFPGYAISRLITANGGNIMSFIPFNADYVHDISKGKATGITQALASAGSFFGSVFITICIANKVDVGKVHIAAGIIILVSAILYSIGLKGGKYFLS